MAATQQRAWLAVGVASLLGGWLAPQYAAKLWGTELSRFLQDSPFSAGVLVECFWVLLLIPGALGFKQERQQQPLEPPARCRACCGQAARAGWCLALQLGGLVALVHVAWFSSFSKTNVATNTLLWNTDTLTTPLAALVIARERPTTGAMIGGLVGLLGAGLAVGASPAGDTLLGCGLVFAASFGFAVNTVLVEKVRDPRQVSVLRLLGLEGVVATTAVCLTLLAAAAWRPEVVTDWVSALPSMEWLAFLGLSSLFLNIGWLWCAEMAGAFWTAMVACSTIPITVVLDVVLMGMQPTPATLCGSFLVILGFVIASWPSPTAEEPEVPQEAVMGDCCRRWHGWAQARAAPLLPPQSPGSASTAETGAGTNTEEACSDDCLSSCSSRERGPSAEGLEEVAAAQATPTAQVDVAEQV